MSDAMEVLYSYAQDYMLRGILAEEPDYADALLHADRQEAQFRTLLNNADRARLESLLEEYNLLASHRGQALFCAGFRLATELSRA